MTDSAPPDLLIFDCDGVLVDSESVANRVWVELLREHGLSFTSEAFLRRSVGSTLVALYEGLGTDFGWQRPEGFDAEIDARLAIAFRDVRAVPGVPELLHGLTIPFCVASNSRLDRLNLKLEAAGLAGFFAGRVFHAGQVARGKPAPDLFLYAAQTLGATPGRCLVIEDSVLGVRAAVAAGMTAWGFTGASHALPDLADELRTAGAREIFSSVELIQAALNA